ncbi:hypothetical protein ANCCAN_02560 [Ancylostoma caninum]|uniref:SCP domain-containing protein n=1 Tax=Ancylostoma caninum TaxID=29170 RepID=A0A368H6D9_ANCCA|nr:hypothetical protein ANCCAN_02560 [Ancylostoma caninum]
MYDFAFVIVLWIKSPKPCDMNKAIKEALNKWWNEVRSATLVDDNKYDETAIKHFGQMAYGKTSLVGCSTNFCSGQLNLVCLYNEKYVFFFNVFVFKAAPTKVSVFGLIACVDDDFQ